jgi:hypothetical protein
VAVGAGFDDFYWVGVVEVVVFDVGQFVVQVVELGIVAVAGIDIYVVDAIFILHDGTADAGGKVDQADDDIIR